MQFREVTAFFPILEEGPTAFVQRFFAVTGACPNCNTPLPDKVRERFLRGRRVKCNNCSSQFNWREGTPLKRSRCLTDAKFVVLLLGLTWGVEPVGIAAVMSVDPQTVRDWRDRLQLMMRTAA